MILSRCGSCCLIPVDSSYEEPKYMYSHYSLVADESTVIAPSSAVVESLHVTDIIDCSRACSNHVTFQCVSFVMKHTQCDLYDTDLKNTSLTQVVFENDSQIWSLVNRYEMENN